MPHSPIQNLKNLCRVLKTHQKDQFIQDPIYAGSVSTIDVWDKYLECDDPPLLPKYCFFSEETLEILIVELPKHLHEYFAEQILLQMGRQCPFLDSEGTAIKQTSLLLQVI
jgi:hypothetical protein